MARKKVDIGPHYYTKSALEALQGRLTDTEAELAEALLEIGAAAEADSNTWHDNAAFDAANEEVRRLMGQKAQLVNLLSRATLHEETNNGSVGVGSRVNVLFEGDDEPETIEIGGHHVVRNPNDDGYDAEVVSSESPLGAALLGAKIGEVLTYQVGGRSISLVIKGVS